MEEVEFLGTLEGRVRAQLEAELERLAQDLGLRRRVLLVDDEVDGTRLLQRFLERRGHRTRVAFDLPHALRLLTEFEPDVCVMDLDLPSGDGCSLAEAASARDPRPRLVALTGHAGDAHRDRAVAAGCDSFFVKPTALRQLLLEIEGA